MAADTVLTLLPLPVPAPAPAAAPASSASPAPTAPFPGSAPSSEPRAGGSRARGAAGSDSSAAQSPPSAGGGSAGADGSGSRGADAVSSDPSSSGPQDKGRSAPPGQSGGSSRAGRQVTRTGRASSAAAAKAAARAPAATDNFSATLAQSLAATPADGAASTGKPALKANAKSGTDESNARPAKHAAADPVATALALLEHALAGTLLGSPSAPMTSVAATAVTGRAVSSRGDHSTTAAKGAASALGTQLIQALATDAKATGATNGSNGVSSDSTAATAAAQLAAGSHAAALQQAKPEPPTMTLSSPVGSNAWTDELGTKLTWMAHQGIESASLQMSPEHLGPLQVSISVHNGQASVWFGAAQPDTRTALQQSLPQLRQLFANQGLTLADAGVSRESPRGQDRQSPTRAAAPVAGVGSATLDSSGGRISSTGGLGLLDTYA